MAMLFIEGFDKYGPNNQTAPTPASLLLAGEWTTVNVPTNTVIVAGLSSLERSDSGTRTADVRCVSNGANSAGNASGFTPGTTFSWLDTTFETDPNTGVAWTGTGVNAALAGPKMAS